MHADPAPLEPVRATSLSPLTLVGEGMRSVFVDLGWSTVTFEVTPLALRKVEANPLGTGTVAWPRAAVRRVGVSRVLHRITLDIADADPVEVNVGREAAGAEDVLRMLRAALDAVAPAPVGEQLAAAAVDRLRPSPRRSALLATGYCLSIAGFACPPIAWPLSIYLFMFAAIPLGIAWGTQRKDTWA